MSSKSTDTPDWMALQKQMLDTWLQTMSQFNGGKPEKSDTNSMIDGMSQWWKTVSSSLPDGSDEFLYKLMEQGTIYYFLGEQFQSLLKTLDKTNRMSGEWQQSLNEQFDEMKSLFTGKENPAAKTMHGMLGAWQQLPMDTLQRTLSFGSVMPGDFLQDLKPEQLENITDKFLSIPGVGYTREHQEQIQEGVRLLNEFYKTSQEYNARMSNIGIQALDVMRQKIIDMSENGEEINSLRQIYDLWVDCNENAYAEYVYSDEYSELYGRLTNALMAVKHHGRNSVDEMLSALSMPTHRTMTTMQKRQQEIRREQKQNERLVEYLRQEITGLKTQMGGKGMAQDAGRKSAAGGTAGKKKKKKRVKKAASKPVRKTAGTTAKKKKKKKPKKKTAKKKTAKKTAAKKDKIVIKI